MVSFGHFIEKEERWGLNYHYIYVFEQADDFEWHSAGLGLKKVLFAGLFYPDSKPAINWKLIAWDMK